MFRELKYICLYILVLAMIAGAQGFDETEKKVKTVYDINGRPVQSSETNKGWHYVQGSATLSSGKATVTLNTSTANGKQDISFLADSTYYGTAWALDSTNIKRYRVNPLSGTQFMIISDSTNDSSTVQYIVQGQ